MATASDPAGYSGTPLARKLGLREGARVVALDAPPGYADWLAPLPAGVRFDAAVSAATDMVHVFCDRRASLGPRLHALRGAIAPAAAVWVSWPKKASGVATDLSDNAVRELALPLGFVDVKVCAVSAVWSGLKLVIRKELRA